MPQVFWLFAAALIIMSPLILPMIGKGVFDVKSFLIAAGMSAVAALLPLFGFGDPSLVWQVLLAQTLLFAAYVSVSRMRQRKSALLHAAASIASNGGWFLTMFVLVGAYTHAEHTLHGGALTREFVGFLAATIAGILTGRLVGVQWMQWVENRFKVRTDSVGNSTLAWIDSKVVPALSIALVACVATFTLFGLVPLRDVLIVTFLGFLQNGVYAINTRLANRDHPGWPVVTGIIGGVVFIVHWTYLIGYTSVGGAMPLVLLIPYTIATVAGSNMGAMLSMFFEDKQRIKADAHVAGKAAYAKVSWHRFVLAVVAVFCGIYLLDSDAILAYLGASAHAIVLPFSLFAGMPYARPLSLALGGLIFFGNNITHTLSSRAGNRNHAPYHALTCLLHGFVTFLMGAFVVLNARFLDLIPVAAFGSAAGQLFAQRVSMWVEKRLESVMDDVPAEPKKSA